MGYVQDKDLLTPEQVKSSVEYKATERALKAEFPWIKKVQVRDDEVNKYNLIFLDIYVDPFIMRNYTGALIFPWVITTLKNKRDYRAMGFSTLLDMTYEESKEIEEKMEQLMRQIHDSAVIPTHLKLPRNRKLQPGSIIVDKDIPIPKEYTMDADDVSRELDRIRQQQNF